MAVIYRGISIRQGTFDKENIVCVFISYCIAGILVMND